MSQKIKLGATTGEVDIEKNKTYLQSNYNTNKSITPIEDIPPVQKHLYKSIDISHINLELLKGLSTLVIATFFIEQFQYAISKSLDENLLLEIVIDDVGFIAKRTNGVITIEIDELPF